MYIRFINLGSGNKCRKHCIVKYILEFPICFFFTITIQQRKCFGSSIIINYYAGAGGGNSPNRGI